MQFLWYLIKQDTFMVMWKLIKILCNLVFLMFKNTVYSKNKILFYIYEINTGYVLWNKLVTRINLVSRSMYDKFHTTKTATESIENDQLLPYNYQILNFKNKINCVDFFFQAKMGNFSFCIFKEKYHMFKINLIQYFSLNALR